MTINEFGAGKERKVEERSDKITLPDVWSDFIIVLSN